MLIILLQIVQGHYFLNSSVIELDSYQLDDAFNQTDKSWFVLFYRPSCPHCLSVIPTWKTFANQHQGNISYIGSVNCDEHQEMAQKVQLHGAPTFILFNSSQQKRYFEGDKTQEQFYQFMSQNYDKLLMTDNSEETSESLNQFLKIGIPLISGFLIIIAICIYRYRKRIYNLKQSNNKMVEIKQKDDEQQI